MGGLLESCGLRQKYEHMITHEKVTLENFAKLLEMDQSGLTSTLLKRCKMSCGDFIELARAYEKIVLRGKSLAKYNAARDSIRSITSRQM